MTPPDPLSEQRLLIQSLVHLLQQENPRVDVFETHISWVLVTARFACKFKKAVHFDFLDFSTLAARRFYCAEELRLNRRLAPALYLDVATVSGSPENPRIDAAGVPIEYAVRMRTFPQSALWNHRIAMKSITADEVDALAMLIARFHHDTDRAAPGSAWGTPEALQAAADETLTTLAALAEDADMRTQVREIRAWHATQQQALHGVFAQRKAAGMIRECHGDLHGANILTVDGQVQAFDCIEFNESLRWIDVMNDIAFVCMDLEFQQRPELAAHCINQYLQMTGDHEGLAVFNYYKVHRALVRAKVALLRARQLRQDGQDFSGPHSQAGRYLAFSMARLQPAPAAIMITFGLSGSGKSTFATSVVEAVGAIQLRSDVERKRLHGMTATQRAAAAPGAGLYDAEATARTYARLLELARHIVEAGLPVIVDAAFLREEQRNRFAALAHRLGVPFFLFEVRASEKALQARIVARARQNRDASDAGLDVLAHQLAEHDPLTMTERQHAITVDTGAGSAASSLAEILEPVLRALQRPAPNPAR